MAKRRLLEIVAIVTVVAMALAAATVLVLDPKLRDVFWVLVPLALIPSFAHYGYTHGIRFVLDEPMDEIEDGLAGRTSKRPKPAGTAKKPNAETARLDAPDSPDGEGSGG